MTWPQHQLNPANNSHCENNKDFNAALLYNIVILFSFTHMLL